MNDKDKIMEQPIHELDDLQHNSIERKLRESELRYRSLVELSPDAIVVHCDGKYVFANAAAARLFGADSPDRILGKRVLDLIPDDYREFISERIRQVEEKKMQTPFVEAKILRLDGAEVHVEATAAPIVFMGRSATQVIIRDITERKRVENELNFEREKLKGILAAMSDYVCIIDRSYNIKYVNSAITKELGPVGNLKCFEYFHGLPKECPWCKNREIFSGKTVREERYGSITRKIYDVINTPLRNKDGSIDKLVILRDITERKHAEEELKQLSDELKRSNADLQQFAYAASHDLQEPLRVIEGFVKLLEKRYRGRLDEKADEFFFYIVDGVKRMQELIKDLLEYSKVGTGIKKFESTDSTLILNSAISNLRTAIEDSRAVVTYHNLPVILADRIQLSSLFQNLIGNAIKFRGTEAPKIHISAKREGHEWIFSVRDNGIGVDPKFADRIFSVFQRLHTRDEYPGTGIGLAICKKIVERHGGRIWLESTPGEGSTFYFAIPDRELITYTPDRRRKDRIRQEIPFDFYYRDQHLTANTVDLSEEGLSIKILGKSSVTVGNTLDISVRDSRVKTRVIWMKNLPEKSLVGLQKIAKS